MSSDRDGSRAAPSVARVSTEVGASSTLERTRAWLDRQYTRIACSSALLVLVLAGAYSVALGGRLRYPDEQAYVQIAEHVGRSAFYSEDGVHPTAWQPPGFGLLLGGLRALGLGVLGYRLVNVLLLSVTVLLLAELARRVYSKAAGSVAAILLALYPLGLYTATTLYPQTLAALLLAGALLVGFSVPAAGGRPLWRAAGCGVLFGALLITVPTYGLALPLFLIWLWRRRSAAGSAAVVVALLCALLVPAAWTARNFATFRSVVVVSTNDGSNLLIGNNPRATPTTGVGTYEDRFGQGTGPDVELARRDADRAEALRWIREHPRQASWLYLGKYLNNFNYRNGYFTRSRTQKLQDVVGAITFFPLLLLFLVRCGRMVRRRGPVGSLEPVLVGIVLGTPFLLAVFFTRLRFRVPLDLVMIVVVAGFVVWFLERPRERQATMSWGQQRAPQESSAGPQPADLGEGSAFTSRWSTVREWRVSQVGMMQGLAAAEHRSPRSPLGQQ